MGNGPLMDLLREGSAMLRDLRADVPGLAYRAGFAQGCVISTVILIVVYLVSKRCSQCGR